MSRKPAPKKSAKKPATKAAKAKAKTNKQDDGAIFTRRLKSLFAEVSKDALDDLDLSAAELSRVIDAAISLYSDTAFDTLSGYLALASLSTDEDEDEDDEDEDDEDEDEDEDDEDDDDEDEDDEDEDDEDDE